MKMLFLGQYYDNLLESLLLEVNKRGLSGAGNTVQNDLIIGFEEVLGPGNLECETTVPAALYPANCKKPFFYNMNVKFPNGLVKRSLGFINLPFLKELCRFVQFYRRIMDWAKSTPGDKIVFTYAMYVPIMRAILCAQNKLKTELKTCIMVSDLPNKFGLESGRKGIMKLLERFDGRTQLRLVEKFDSFVLMSDHMREVIHFEDKPYCVVEGIVNVQRVVSHKCISTDDSVIVFYGGILDKQYGIAALLDAFRAIESSKYRLWLCGQGDMVEQIKALAEIDSRINYYGYLSKAEATEKMMQATILVNPRPDDNLFTKYSFPSKNMEYLLSGKPVICYRLKGIPQEYDAYFCYAYQSGTEEFKNLIMKFGSMDKESRMMIGTKNRQFVITNKNCKVQTKRIVNMLESIT